MHYPTGGRGKKKKAMRKPSTYPHNVYYKKSRLRIPPILYGLFINNFLYSSNINYSIFFLYFLFEIISSLFFTNN